MISLTDSRKNWGLAITTEVLSPLLVSPPIGINRFDFRVVGEDTNNGVME